MIFQGIIHGFLPGNQFPYTSEARVAALQAYWLAESFLVVVEILSEGWVFLLPSLLLLPSFPFCSRTHLSLIHFPLVWLATHVSSSCMDGVNQVLSRHLLVHCSAHGCYELGDGPRAYRGSIFSARTRLQLMCCATRRLLSSNFGRETDEDSEVRMVSSRDNQCRFQTEEHTWGSEHTMPHQEADQNQ